MKAKLIEITKEMTGSTELAETLNENFNTLNDMAAQREDALFKGLKEMETRIIKSIQASETRLETKLETKLVKRLDAILKINGIDPNLLQEDEGV